MSLARHLILEKILLFSYCSSHITHGASYTNDFE